MKELEYFRSMYRLPGHDNPTTVIGRVVYQIFNHQYCVFCGLDHEAQSTINAAEDIITLICRGERIDPRQMTFYDLQTYQSYRNPEGHFEYERLQLAFNGRRQFHVEAWRRENCPAEVMSTFADQISSNPYQQKNSMDYRPGAYQAMLEMEVQRPKPELRKQFVWVEIGYEEAIQKFGEHLADGYQRLGIPRPEFMGLLMAIESSCSSGMGRPTFARMSREMVQYLASWVGHLLRQTDSDEQHAYNQVLNEFVRTLVRAIRLNEIYLRGDHAFYYGYELPDWFVGWAFTWSYTPGEEGDA